MKNLKYLFLLSTVLLLASCNDIHFEQPQPAGKKEIMTIPKKYSGEYLYRDTTMKIDENDELAKFFSKKGELPVLEVNKVMSIYPKMVTAGYKGKLLFNEAQTKKVNQMGWNADSIAEMFGVKAKFIKTERKDGKLSFYYNGMDTLISISRGDVIKKFKGHLYLNKNDGENAWVVYKVKKRGGTLLVTSLNSDDKDLLKTICPKEPGKNFDPAMKQFKLFLKKGGFRQKEIYLKK